MKRGILLLLLALCAVVSGQTLPDYYGYSAAQLSAMTDYVTIPNTAYWNSHAYLQLALLIDRFKNTPVRNRGDFSTITDWVYNNTTSPVAGKLAYTAGAVDTVNDYDDPIWLTSNTMLDFTGGLLYYKAGHVRNDTCSTGMFKAEDDSNITVIGGTWNGLFNASQTTGSVVSSGDYSIVVSGLDVAADSMQYWHIRVTSGGGSNQIRRIVGNNATVSGNTTIHVDSTSAAYKFSPHPDGTYTYMVTPMNQWEAPLCFTDCKNIYLRDMYMKEFASYIEFSNCENVYIDHLYIDNHDMLHYNQSNGYAGPDVEWLAGNSCLLFNADPQTKRCDDWALETNTNTATKNVYITNSTFAGGYANIYFENEVGSGAGTFDNIVIDNCRFDDSILRVAGVYHPKYKNLRITNCVFTENCAGMAIQIWEPDSTSNFVIDNCTFYNCTAAEAVYCTSGTNNVTITNCHFINITGYPINAFGGSNYRIEGNEFVNCTHAVNFYLSGTNAQLITASNDRTFTSATNWYGTNWTVSGGKMTHTAGSAVAATLDATFLNTDYNVAGRRMNISLDVSCTGAIAGTITLYIGTQSIATIDTVGTFSYRFYLTTAGSQPLFIVPHNTFNGAVDNVVLTTNYREARNWSITGNKFFDCGSGDDLHCPMYVAGLYNSVIAENRVIISDSTSITSAHPFYINGGDSLFILNNITKGYTTNTPIMAGMTTYVAAGNQWGFPAAGGSVSYLQTDGAAQLDSAWYAMKGTNYVALDSTMAKGEIASKANPASDWGFMRLSAGGGTNKTNKSAIDLIGYSTFGLANRIQFYTQGELRAIMNTNGLAVQSGKYINFDTTMAASGYGFRDNSGTVEAKNSGGTWMRILQFIGAKNPTYDATVGDLWFSSKRDTLFYQVSADSSYYILRDGVVTGKH
jgi:hypothetical protein